MLTQRSRYALRALIFLARTGSVAPVPISVIAADQKLPRKFLEIILLDLKNGGLVASYRGKLGGYRLAQGAGRDQLRRDHPPDRGAAGAGAVRQRDQVSPLRRLFRRGDVRHPAASC